ncbi:MAG: D-tyrosyl-tRNA(Tyr) deacylase [Clostridium sp.]|mgnify:CR=1 FL=1|jgi:D-tyrosyl-tRNA(Tyr) deacylase|nr:D-tyrosyl-tRNA(Tyr) deacylase [Clostridium sp.]
MRAVVQRVKSSKVTVEGETVGAIEKGLMVLLGVGADDTERDVEYLADKIVNLRIFEDENGKMNISLKDVGGDLLVVSQFTLYGDCRKGKRPSFDKAAGAKKAEELYERFVKACRDYGLKVESGKFQAEMMVEIYNNGPVTILLDSSKEF